MTRAEELAAELERATGDIHAELGEIPDERWHKAITGPEGWPVGHAAHHIGEGYLLSLSWIERATADGQPVVLDPTVDIPAINATNARCLEEHGNEPRPVTMDFLRASARTLIDRVARLTDEQLDEPMMIVMGEERTGSLVALPMALRHANNHLQSIRDASVPG
jgi:hypothetical protein